MDYDEMTVNPLVPEEGDTKSKRRYWAAKEEEGLFEIWGRENWRLTRHGKNTLHFAQWSQELKERYDITVKPEEIQMKVNQTRAKFRSVKKQGTTRWKKYELVEKILRNQYRPEDADPLPPEAYERNRDFSPTPKPERATTPPSNETQSAHTNGSNGNEQHLIVEPNVSTVSNLNITADTSVSNSMYNTSVELFTDPHLDEVKTDYNHEIKQNDDFQNNYHQNYQYQEQNHFVTAPSIVEPQLHQLKTPQQQQLEEMQQHQQIHQYDTQYHNNTQVLPIVVQPEQTLTEHIQQLQHEQQQMQQHQQHETVFNHSNNIKYTVDDPTQTPTPAVVTNNGTVLHNHQNHYINSPTNVIVAEPLPQPISNDALALTTTTNITDEANLTIQQPPTRTYVAKSRRRRPNLISSSNVQPAAESLEALFLDEMRKKNIILEENNDISRKRLALEQRKVSLMEQYFPKCLEMQEKIMEKLSKK